MARKPQQLINYHTGSLSNMPLSGDVQFGEIVVRHNAEKPELLIKVSEGTQGSEGYKEYFVPFISSGAVYSAITAAVTGSEGELDSKISDLTNSLNAISGEVKSNYAYSSYTHDEIVEAKDSAVSSAASYAVAQDKELSGNLITYIDSASGAIESTISDQLSRISALETFSGVVESDYATKEFVGAASGYAYNQAKSDVIGAAEDTKDDNTVYGAKAYAKDINDSLSANLVTYTDQKFSDVTSDSTTLSGNVTTLSGSVITLSGDLKTYIDNELSVVYKYKGSVADVAALGSISDKENGDVYNVVAQNGNPGEAGYTPAGTNYAWVADESEQGGGHWDPLGGVVDLSNYATTGTTHALDERIGSLESADSTKGTALSAVSASLLTLSGSVVDDYSTTSEMNTAIGAASAAAVTSAYTASSAYTDGQIQMLSGITSAYVAGQVTQINNDINGVKSTYAVSSITHTEIEAAKTAVIGEGTEDSAATNTLIGLKQYSDEKDRLLHEEIEQAISSFSGAMSGDFSSIETQISQLGSRVTENENKFTNSAATWNSALQHGELGTVSETAAGNGVTIQSGAKLKDDASTKKLTLDLSGLIVDCGDF